MTLYRGNVVSYGSGGRWYAQMIVTDSGGTTHDVVNVTYTYQIVFEHSISDSVNTINWSDPWGAGSANNYRFTAPGTYTVGQFSASAHIGYDVQNRLHFRLYATGMAGGGTGPSVVEFDHLLPARHAAPPSPPPISHHSITPTSVQIVVEPSQHTNGAGVDRYEVYILTNNAWPAEGGNVVESWAGGSGGAWRLLPSTTYFYTARAHNAAGWSGWSAMRFFETLPSGMVNINGRWVNAIPYVNINGRWVMAIPYININGRWLLS